VSIEFHDDGNARAFEKYLKSGSGRPFMARQRRAWPGRPGWQYHRVFSFGFGGLLFFVAGLIGWDLNYSRGWFEATTWTDAPIWWQVALGTALLLLAGFWARRVPTRVTR